VLRLVAWAGLWYFGLVVLAGLLLRGWLGDALFVTRYTGYAMPWLVLGLVPGMIGAARAGRRWLALVLASGTALVAVHHATLFRYRPTLATPPAALSLRVASYNSCSRNGDVVMF
jgi:hypothetical protein